MSLGMTPAPSSLDSEAAYLHQELKALPGPIHLVGHSFGGGNCVQAGDQQALRTLRSEHDTDRAGFASILLEHEARSCRFTNRIARESERICTPIWLGDKERGLQQFLTFWNGLMSAGKNLSRDRKALS
jgi:hypothetical protein